MVIFLLLMARSPMVSLLVALKAIAYAPIYPVHKATLVAMVALVLQLAPCLPLLANFMK